MPKPRVFSLVNRLAKVIDAPNAQPQEVLISKANANVEELGDAFRTHIRAKVSEILAYADQGDDVLHAEREGLGRAALSVAEIAGAANMEAVGEVSRGISAMLSDLASGGWRSDALLVHIRSLGLVSQLGPPTAPDLLVLDRLAAMRKAIGVVE